MNRFENGLIIKEEKFEGGLFIKVPNYDKDGSAFILTEGVGSDLVIDDTTTTRQVRKGQYKKLVEVSTAPYIKEIKFSAEGKETAYSFDIYMKVVIRVEDVLTFYRNRNLDIEGYFNNLLSRDVKKITRKYSVLSYEGMDDELAVKLSSHNTTDKETGISYQISLVDAQLGEKALEIVEKQSNQVLEATLRRNAQSLVDSVSCAYEEAIRTAVVNGELSNVDAIEKIENYKFGSVEKKMNLYRELREQGILTDTDVIQGGRELLSVLGNNPIESIEEIQTKETCDVGKYFDEE